MKHAWILALLLAPLAPASALQLTPYGPSQVVELESGLLSDNCLNPVGAKTFDTRLLADGDSEPFAVPAGRVLVVTQVEILGFGGDPGELVQTRVFRGVGLQKNIAARRESFANDNGRIFHIYQFDPGMVVGPGAEVCMNTNAGLTLTGQLRGFMKTDY